MFIFLSQDMLVLNTAEWNLRNGPKLKKKFFIKVV